MSDTIPIIAFGIYLRASNCFTGIVPNREYELWWSSVL